MWSHDDGDEDSGWRRDPPRERKREREKDRGSGSRRRSRSRSASPPNRGRGPRDEKRSLSNRTSSPVDKKRARWDPSLELVQPLTQPQQPHAIARSLDEGSTANSLQPRLDWIEIALVEQSDHRPIGGVRYRIMRADDTVVAFGELCRSGHVRVTHLPPSVYSIEFPDLDAYEIRLSGRKAISSCTFEQDCEQMQQRNDQEAGCERCRQRDKTSWAVISLYDARQQPIKQAPYQLTDADGEQRLGVLDDQGCATEVALAEGGCEILFYELEKSEFEE